MNNFKLTSKVNLCFLSITLITFISFCYQVAIKQYPNIDYQVLLVFQRDKPVVFDAFFKAVYQAGGTYIAGSIVLLALAILIRKKYWQEAKTLAFSTLGILLIVNEILKPLFDRRRPPRPRLVGDLSIDSFPSGHASGNLVLYYYLSLILATLYPQSAKYIYSLATILVLLIGFSGVYTNAHWMTDIIGGYIFGSLWIIFISSLTFWKSLFEKKI